MNGGVITTVKLFINLLPVKKMPDFNLPMKSYLIYFKKNYIMKSLKFKSFKNKDFYK